MRKLNISYNSSDLQNSEEFKSLMTAAIQNCISRHCEENLLNAVRNGYENAIPALVQSSEPVILAVIKQLGISDNIHELFNEGKKALTELARLELNSTSHEKFFRFGAWHVRQAILRYLEEIGLG